MAPNTKKILILSVVTVLVAVSVLSFFVYKINSEGILLEEKIKIQAENDIKESTYFKLQRLALETEGERALLAESFFTQEGDSINFLSEMETLASTLGLSFKTEALDKIIDKDSKKEFIKISFIYSGQKEVVYKFSKLMEYVPYHSLVESLSLKKVSGNNWEGQLTILITLNSI
jgi:hypothetical protein